LITAFIASILSKLQTHPEGLQSGSARGGRHSLGRAHRRGMPVRV